jgi:hypothetical protein
MVLKLHMKEPLVKLRTLLSESAGFQSLTDSDDATEALTRIHYGYAEDGVYSTSQVDQTAKSLPRAIVAFEDLDSSKATTGSFESTILLSLLLESTTPTAQQSGELGERYVWWLGQCETIVDDLRELTAYQQRLLIETYSTSIPPQKRAREKNDAEEWVAAFVMEVRT